MIENGLVVYHIVTRNKMRVGQIIDFSEKQKNTLYRFFFEREQLNSHGEAFAIISRLNKVDVYSIMRSLGHERLETTEIYLETVFAKENHAIHSWKPEMFGEYI